jgi:hypothetical protein
MTARTCRPWCVDHLADDDMCIAPAITLTFGDRGDDLFIAGTAATDLTEAPDNCCIMLHVNGHPMVELDPRQAAAIGAALLAQSARALGDSESAGYYRDMAAVNADTAARSAR